jgi:hypothetical protein
MIITVADDAEPAQKRKRAERASPASRKSTRRGTTRKSSRKLKLQSRS